MRNISKVLHLFPIATMLSLSIPAAAQSPTTEAEHLSILQSTENLNVASREWMMPRQSGIMPFVLAEAAKAPRRQFPKVSAESPVGEWILRYEPLLATSGRGGCAVTVTSTGAGKLEIANFWMTGTKVTATFDSVNGVIKIPYQYLTTHSTYGKMNVASLDHATGRPLTAEAVEFHATADGTFVSDTWWGIVATTGDNRGEASDAYCNSTMVKGNATMSSTDKDGVVSTYPVIASQTGTNLLTIANFRNYGFTVDITLKSDRSAVIPHQVGYEPSSSAQYLTIGNLKLDDKGNPTSWTDDIPVPVAPSVRKLEWTDWSMILGNSYWTGFNGATAVEMPFDIVFPAAPAQSDFAGEGTEQSPWLIATAEDIVLLKQKADAAAEGTEETPANLWEGKYFRVASDIDMKNYRLSAIVNGKTKVFAGDFNGDSHTISNFSIAENGSAYAALFGAIAPAGRVRNLKIANAAITATSAIPAVIASQNAGKIENCHITGANVATSAQGAAGVAGISAYTDNCSVTGSRISAGSGFTGALVAQLTGPLVNSYAEETVVIATPQQSAGTPIGGLVGAANANSITDCYFQGIVTTAGAQQPTSMGGIAGAVNGGSITRCMAVAQLIPILGETQLTGGIVGAGVTSMTDCLSSSWIRSPLSQYTAGLIGLSQHSSTRTSSFTRCVSTSRVEAAAPADSTFAELIGSFDSTRQPPVDNCYFDRQLTDFGSPQGLTTAQLTAGSLQGFDQATWTLGSGLYPRLKNLASKRPAHLAASALSLPDFCSYSRSTRGGTISTDGTTKFAFRVDGKLTETGRFGKISGNKLLLNDNLAFGTDTIVACNGEMLLPYPITLLPIPYEGEGSAASPYLIRTKDDLIALGAMTTTWGLSYADMHFLMTADIDMEYTDSFRGLSYSNTSTSPYTFQSTFDGGGHKISRMRIGDLVWKVRPEEDPKGLGTVDTDNSRATWIGFVGRLGESGVVRNLTISADCRYEAFASAGAIAGWNYGLIENCTNYADIAGQSSWIGGIAGQTLKGSKITGCFNSGRISTGYRNAGGIVSTITQGLVADCVNTGDVSADEGYQLAGKNQLRYAGGITGSINGGRVQNCLNSGNIFALEGYAGGIAGNATKAATTSPYTSDMISCVSYGSVDGDAPTTNGGMIGESISEGIVSNCYFDCQSAPYAAIGNASSEGVTGIIAAKFVDGTLPSGLSPDIWSAEKGRYPVMKAFMNQPLMMAASRVYIEFAGEETSLYMKNPATLSQPEGIVWKLASSKSFGISGNRLTLPAEITAIITDTISGSLDGYTKTVRLRAVPTLQLTGSGTADNPYLIAKAADWNLLSDYISQTLLDYFGAHFKVSNDIDFGGAEMKTLGTKDVAFEATLDGDNHKISNFTFTAAETVAGPITVLGTSATVKNLTMAGTVTTTATTTKSHLGGFAGKVLGKLIDCVNLSEISTAKGYAGGLAGTSDAGAEFIRCVNKGEVKAFGNIGGIVADVAGRARFEDCSNEGILNDQGTTSTYANYVGGIAARAVESDFIRCINKGEFKFAVPEKTFGIGGLVGYLDGKKGNEPHIFTDCVNESPITAGADLGGITGSTVSTVGAARAIYTNCVNNGEISSSATTSGSYSVGGIAAKYKPGFQMVNCVNNGKVSSVKQHALGGIAGNVSGVPTAEFPVLIDSCRNNADVICGYYMVGGIISNVNTFTTIRACGNSGRVEGTYGAGGIAGALYGLTGEIIGCWNSGDVVTSGNRTGGIVGYANNGGLSSKITGCLNMGNVSTTSTKPGTVTTTTDPSGYAIGGIAGLSPSAISGCVNFGTVTGVSQVGGIVGSPVKSRTSVTQCINLGRIEAPADTAANIIGVNIANGKIWDAKNRVDSCFYLDSCGTFKLDEGHAQALDLLTMTTRNFGKKFLADDYCFPLPAAFSELDRALLLSAAVVPAAGDSLENITTNFKVGAPQGLAWTSNPAVLSFEGNDAIFIDDFTGKVTLTATLGEFSKEFEINVVNAASIVNSLSDSNIAARYYYYLNGLPVPAPASGGIYIVKTVFTDGDTKLSKILFK